MQIVIFLKETTASAAYTNQLTVGDTQHRYQVVRLWEQDANFFLTTPALLPFAALASTNSPALLLQQVAARVDMIEELEQKQNISACVEVLAGLRFNKDLLQQFLGEGLMRESVIYQEIIREGKREILLRQLTRRIGTVSPQSQIQIQTLSNQQLDELSEVLLDFSAPTDLTAWLQTQQKIQN